MQTLFRTAQLTDPRLASSNGILRKCVHCGFCTATCPTYLLTGDESDSPRGRIYLIKSMLESGRPADSSTVHHIDRCLSCLSCETTCPADVRYGQLVDDARSHIEETYRRPIVERLLRAALNVVIPRPKLFRPAMRLAALARFSRPVFQRVDALKPVAAMLALAPAALPPEMPGNKAGVHRASRAKTDGAAKGRVILLAGCVQTVLGPQINAATISLLNRLGIDVTIAKDAGCCGALPHHLGKREDALTRARRNIDAWRVLIGNGDYDAIIANASGCGAVLKDYGHMLRLDPDYAKDAERIARMVTDISAFLADRWPEAAPDAPTQRREPLVVAYHAPCSLQHGLKVKSAPVQLLSRAGFDVRAIPEGHLCCGSAGTYNMLQAELADKLLARKLANIARVSPDVIATGNIGCMAQLASGTETPVVHTVELINWALGGARPPTMSDQTVHG